MDKNFLVAVAASALNDLGEARQEWVSAAIELVNAERNLSLANAIARQKVTEAAGGAKGLGSNADLRELALIKALAFDYDYMASLAHRDEAFEREARSKQQMYTLNDTLRLFKAFLEIDIDDPLKRYHIGE